jgi:formylglycine-generating enzyme required for sulfatase activity
MAKKPALPTPTSSDVYKIAKQAIWLDTVEAPGKRAAVSSHVILRCRSGQARWKTKPQDAEAFAERLGGKRLPVMLRWVSIAREGERQAAWKDRSGSPPANGIFTWPSAQTGRTGNNPSTAGRDVIAAVGDETGGNVARNGASPLLAKLPPEKD